MRKIFTLLFLFIFIVTQAQEERRKFITGNDALIYTLQFISGFAQGTEEAIKFHYNQGFKSAFPNANDQFWDPRISWENKNRSNIPFARSVFSFTTDGYHLSRFVSRGSMVASVAISVNDFKGLNKKEKLLLLGKKFTLSMISNRLGQWVMYDVICRERF